MQTVRLLVLCEQNGTRRPLISRNVQGGRLHCVEHNLDPLLSFSVSCVWTVRGKLFQHSVHHAFNLSKNHFHAEIHMCLHSCLRSAASVYFRTQLFRNSFVAVRFNVNQYFFVVFFLLCFGARCACVYVCVCVAIPWWGDHGQERFNSNAAGGYRKTTDPRRTSCRSGGTAGNQRHLFWCKMLNTMFDF